VTSAQVTSVLAVQLHVEPIVSVNGKGPPRDDTNVGRLALGAHDGLGDGDGDGLGDGLGDGEGAVGPEGSVPESPQAPSASTSAQGANRRRNVIATKHACMAPASWTGNTRRRAAAARKFYTPMPFGLLAARERDVEIV
jgi:hypothetical protein